MEVDAYCFSTLATNYAGKSVTETISATSGESVVQPITALNEALRFFDDNEVPAEDQIIFASPKFIQMLRNTGELYKKLDQSEYKKNVSFLIEEYEGRPIVPVAPNRFKTDIVMADKGYYFGSDRHDINFMVVAKSAVYHVVKYNKVRVFAPDVVQDYDGYKVNARIYHDVFVVDNKRVAVYVSLDSGTAKALDTNINVKIRKSTSAKTITPTEIVVTPASALITGYYVKLATSAITPTAVGTDFSTVSSGYTAISLNSAISYAGDPSDNAYYEIIAVAGGRVYASTGSKAI